MRCLSLLVFFFSGMRTLCFCVALSLRSGFLVNSFSKLVRRLLKSIFRLFNRIFVVRLDSWTYPRSHKLSKLGKSWKRI